MKPKHTSHHAPAKSHASPSPAHPPRPASTHLHSTEPDPSTALKTFLQPATADSTHPTPHSELPASSSLPAPRSQLSTPHTPPWSADLAALETKHQSALRTLAAQHQSALAALETRLAAAEHTTANLSGQLRELR